MKISKLFHWLYACIMLMPIFAIGGKLLYGVINPNAKDSWSGTTYKELQPTYYQSNEISSISDLVVGNIYTLTTNDSTSSTERGFLKGELKAIIEYSTIESSEFEPIYPQPYIYGVDVSIIRYIDNNSITYIYNSTVDFVYLGPLTNVQNLIPFISECNRQYVKEYIEVTQQETLDNIFYYSVDQVSREPLFSWANDSFLITPFVYITGLFGLTSSSPLLTILSYWLNISIIWLTFDIVMYVPLLVHRWLDKGVVE